MPSPPIPLCDASYRPYALLLQVFNEVLQDSMAGEVLGTGPRFVTFHTPLWNSDESRRSTSGVTIVTLPGDMFLGECFDVCLSLLQRQPGSARPQTAIRARQRPQRKLRQPEPAQPEADLHNSDRNGFSAEFALDSTAR